MTIAAEIRNQSSCATGKIPYVPKTQDRSDFNARMLPLN
jgi:hypothetical protein